MKSEHVAQGRLCDIYKYLHVYIYISSYIYTLYKGCDVVSSAGKSS